MKKTTLLLFLLTLSSQVSAQILNSPANWPNINWTLSGTYNTDPTAFEADPTVSANFAFDDDDAGSGSDDDIAAESPIIDLSAAFTGGETWLFVDVNYTYNMLADLLTLEYWDSDNNSWALWQQFLETTATPTNNFCSGARDAFTSNSLNIAGFTAIQLSGFKYRISFLDDGGNGGAGWEWGFCFDSPTIYSVTPPTCPDISGLNATNVTGDSADISWQAAGSETEWEYVVQTAGIGEPVGSGNSTIVTTFTETGLSFSTDYEIYVRANCGANGFSNWVGPVNFTTTPQTDFTVDCTQPPLQMNYCYGNNDTISWLFTTNDGSPVRLIFNSGTIESCCDDILIYDGTNNTGTLLYQGNNGGDLAGLTFDSTGDSLFMEVDSDSSVSCASGSRTEWDFTVSCATCVNPVAAYSVVEDCVNGPQFLVDVDLTDLGSANSITISDNQGSAPQTTSATGIFTFGPFANNTDIVITVANDDDANCALTSGSLTQEQCVLNIIDCNAGPVDFLYCYGNNDTTSWLFTTNDGSPIRLVFNSGTIESCCDDILVYDGPNNTGTLLYQGNNGGDLAGLTFDSTGDSLFLEVDSDGSISCASGSRTEWDFTVFCATCVNPQATYQVIDDCNNGDQFLIDVNITSLGDATSLTISDNQGSTPVQTTTTGITQFGPYPFLTDIIITISNDQDVNCVINSSAIQLLACPPDNDNCVNATIAGVNDNALCSISTSGTILAATDSGVPSFSCTGTPDDDVWFEFIALNEVQVISLLNINGGTGDLGHALYDGSCENLNELYCVSDTSSLAISLIVGNTYYIRVFSNTSQPDQTSNFELCIRVAPENTECAGSSPFCADENGSIIFPNTTGIADDTDIACLFSAPNPAWYFIQIQDPGEIVVDVIQNTGFDANGNPIGTGLDVDFVLWGPFAPGEAFCGNLDQGCPNPANCPNNTSNPNFYPYGNIIDCSFHPQDVETFTIDNAQTGEIYVLLVTNYSNDPGFIQLVQTNTGQVGSGSTDCSILCDVDLGEDQDLCGFTSYTLIAESAYADTYTWYLDGFVINGESSNTLEVTESGVYTVVIDNNICEEPAQASATITFYQEAVANAVDDIVTCDDASGDEIEDFNLDSQTSTILGTQDASEFVVTYHLSLADAQAAINPLASPYYNVVNPQTIYVRVEDVNAVGSNSGCFSTTSFDLIISGPTPTATSVNFELCDDSSRDEIESFDLDSHSLNILDGQDDSIYTVTYYVNEANAVAGTNALTPIYENISNPQTIYARVESNQAIDCYSVTSFNLIVNDVPFTSFDNSTVYEVCPNATVPIDVVAIAENYTESDVSINWYQDGVPISGQNGLSIPVLTEGNYTIEVTFNNTECLSSADVTVFELETCVIPQGISPNGDGYNDSFDLSSYDVHKLEIYNRYGNLVYSKENYTNEWVGQSKEGDKLPVGTYFYVMRYQDNKQRAAWIYLNY
ncbi:MAG: gliding motility-associated C-terminal domain-containing protein [Flavobacteriaceae bacterium]|nr:gliding motility-associated C-terminal domain-containing protein [Flavobacteriaceae bacterium]